MTTSPDVEALRREARDHWSKLAVIPAREAFERLLAAAPGDGEALLHLSRIARSLGDLDEAEKQLDAAFKAAPTDPEIRFEVGRSRWRAMDDEAAAPHLAAVLERSPKHLAVAGMLATSLAALGREAEIEPLLEAALRAGAPWAPEALTTAVREAVVEPPVYAALFRAAGTVAGGKAEKKLKARAKERKPRVAKELPEPWRTLLALPEPRRLSACMIVKNEAHNLERALSSLKGVVDELVVVDTGSTDGTVDIAKAHGAKLGSFKWCDDFSAARNASLALATGEWLMIYDADHAIDARCRRSFRTFVQTLRHDAKTEQLQVFAPQIVEHTVDDPARIFTRSYMAMMFPADPDVRYDGVLHEQVTDFREPTRPVQGRVVGDLVIHHYGYTPQNMQHHDKHGRNMRILRMDVEKRPDNPFVHYNLGLQLSIEKDHALSKEHLATSITLSEAKGDAYKPPFLESAYILMATAQLRTPDLPGAAATCEQGLKRYPTCADLLGMLGYVRLTQRRGEEAIPHLQAAVKRRGLIGAHAGNPKFAGWFAELLLGLAHWKRGEAARTDQHLREMWAIATDQAEAARSLVLIGKDAFGSYKTGQALMRRVGVNVDLKLEAPAADAGSQAVVK